MRVSCYVITLHVRGLMHKALRGDSPGVVDETRKYIALGVSPEDARDRVMSRVKPMLDSQFESLSTTWGVDGDRGDIVELAKVDVETHPGTNIPKD